MNIVFKNEVSAYIYGFELNGTYIISPSYQPNLYLILI